MRAKLSVGVIAFLVIAACGADNTSAPTAPSQFVAQFDGLWAKYDSVYPYFIYKKINWDSLRTVYRPRAVNAMSQAELIDILTDMLSNLRDGHAFFIDPSGVEKPTYVSGAFSNWSQPVWAPYMQRYDWHLKTNYLGYATIDSVPYVFIATWKDANISAAAVDSIIDLFPNAPAYIFDVRLNDGGDTAPAFLVAERFYDTMRAGEYTLHRIGPSHSNLAPATPVYLTPRGAKAITKPVLILTGRASISAAEDFVSAMQVLPNVTTAGDTTAGVAGYPISETLGNGWTYSLPTAMVFTGAMKVIEWNGIAPSVYVRTTPADFAAGVDPVFEYAVRWAATHSGQPAAAVAHGVRKVK
jgi:hypothetical protein